MAQVLDVIEAKYHFRDVDVEKGVASSSLFLPSTTPIEDAVTYFDLVGDLIDGVSGCVLYDYQLILHYIEDAYIKPDTDDDVEFVGLFEFGTADGKSMQVIIPSLDEDLLGIFQTDNININQDHADVVAFLDMMIDGDGTTVPCDKRGQDIEESSGTTGSYRAARAVKYHTGSHASRGGRAG
jgi:hypothetical protein